MNVANALTGLRLLMIPVAAWMFAFRKFDAAAAVFLAACLTDVLDGFIARRFNMITDVGKLLDPLADKGMQLTVLISLSLCGRMPLVAVGVILAKELLMFFGGLFLYKKKIVVSANWYGKAATVLISACVTTVLLFYEKMSPWLLCAVQWLPVLAAAGAFVLYLSSFLKTVQEGKLL
ncbi:MAG: CDP-alcohol phosphatidyltransferase family protein [Clostridia bacterium]|nr:CDP-alcohol phosphatidyltransferase family protein [Clostridia bacterium]